MGVLLPGSAHAAALPGALPACSLPDATCQSYGQGWAELLEVLVKELGDRVDAPDSYQFTPLHSAAIGGHAEAAARLLDLGHPPDPRDCLGAGASACNCVGGCGSQALAAAACKVHGSSPRCGDPIPAGRTPLHYAAMHGRVAVTRLPAQRGAALEASDVAGGDTPLHLAADAAQCDAVAALVELGAALDARGKKGHTPLALALLKVRARWA